MRRIGANTIWLTGVAANLPQLRDRFEWTILLRIDTPTMLARLRDTQRGNDFGNTGDSLEYLIHTMAAQQDILDFLCDTSVDATAPLDRVAENVLAETAQGWLTST